MGPPFDSGEGGWLLTNFVESGCLFSYRRRTEYLFPSRTETDNIFSDYIKFYKITNHTSHYVIVRHDGDKEPL